MAERRSLFSRFWPPSASRRPSATQTTAPPPAINSDTPIAESKPGSQTNSTSTTPKADMETPARQSTTTAGSPPPPTPTPTIPSTTERQMTDQPTSSYPEPRKSPSSQVQTASQPPTITSSNPIDEPKTSSPSRGTTQSPSTSKPASPYLWVAQSRSPPQPSSPTHGALQTQRMGSQTPSTPKRASQPHSPSRLTSHSPKQGSSSSSKGTQPTSPSKESRKQTQEISSSQEAPILAYNGEHSKPAASQQEPKLKTEVKSGIVNDLNGQTLDGTSFKHDEVEPKPSQSPEGTKTTKDQSPEAPAPSKVSDSSTINGVHEDLVESNATPAENKNVKEVVQAATTEANAGTKKEVTSSLASKSGSKAKIIEKAEISSKPDQINRDKQEPLHTKEILDTFLTGATSAKITTSQPKKRSTISTTHDKFAQREHVPLDKNIQDDMSRFVNQMATGEPKTAIYDKPVSLITLAGENRGASMQMESNSSKSEGPVHIHRRYKNNPDESAEATTDGKGSPVWKKSRDENSTDDQPTEAYINNNAQGINNSIVFNSSITEGNSGVHMVVSHLPKEPIQSTKKKSPPQTRKAEFNRTHAEKLTYQPTVRRRCLRGLFLETSDSDAENPEKPRRHGCRVGCQKKDKENNIDVL